MVRHPAVLAALALLVIPVLVHLLVRAPARVVDLPSLRFVPASRLHALRRHRLADRGLLALRLLVLLCAIAAFADPFVVTACRTRMWDARLAQAVVVHAAPDAQPPERAAPPHVSTRIDVEDANEGVRRAMAWLSTAPPARREIVVMSAFRLGSLDPQVVREVPEDVGLRFVRLPAEPATRTAKGPVYVRLDGEGTRATTTTVRTDGATTEIVETGPDTQSDVQLIESGNDVELSPWGIAVRGTERDVARAALRSVLRAGIAPPAVNDGRPRPRMVVQLGAAPAGLQPAAAPAVGPVVSALVNDRDLAGLARSTTPSTAHQEGTANTAQVLFRGADGQPVVTVGASATEPPELVVHLAVLPASPLLPLVIQRLARATVAPFDPLTIETATVPNGTLEAWSRAPGPVTAARAGGRVSDRRLFWTAVLVLLAVETVVRRGRRTVGSSATASNREDAA
ncbi:MAG TPA: BatA domain-containing protein [Vicinamibacterales bacterium]